MWGGFIQLSPCTFYKIEAIGPTFFLLDVPVLKVSNVLRPIHLPGHSFRVSAHMDMGSLCRFSSVLNHQRLVLERIVPQ